MLVACPIKIFKKISAHIISNQNTTFKHPNVFSIDKPYTRPNIANNSLPRKTHNSLNGLKFFKFRLKRKSQCWTYAFCSLRFFTSKP